MHKLLDGLRVVEVGDGIAGAAAAATLASLGASVTKVVDRDLVPPDHEPALTDGGPPAITATLDREKSSVAAGTPEADDAWASATVVIDDRIARRPLPPRPGQGSAGVLVTITPFGLDGPRAGDPGGELVAEAAGGLLATVEPEGGGRPVSPPGFVALRAVGSVAALAALHGLDRHRRTDRPVHIDISAQEAVVFTAALPECAHVLYRCPGRAGSGRYLAPSGLFPCRDGLVRIAAIEDHQWQGLVACLGAPDWTAGLEHRAARAEHAGFITEHVAAWTATRDKADCADQLQGNGVPATPVNGPAELLASPQLRHRGSFVSATVEGVPCSVLGPPWRLAPAPPSPGTGPEACSLEDLVVAELTHVLAGPIVGSLLGAMGATVVRFEDRDRLDIYRRTGPFADGRAGLERGAYFAVANHSKHSVAADGAEAVASVGSLLSGADVVIENVGRRRLDRLAVDPAKLAAQGRLFVSVSGFGTDGPLAEYRVYANNVQAYGGLADLTRDGAGEPARLGTVLADPLSSVVSATVVAAWALGPARSAGAVVDVAMAEVVAGTIAEFVAAASTGTTCEPPLGNDLFPYAPHGVYPTRDGRWLALAVETDDDWRSVVGVFDNLDEPAWADAGARWTDRAVIDALITVGTVATDADILVSVLRAAGVPCSIVLSGADLVADPHLAARGFFPEVEHPDPDLGRGRLVGLPWRFAGDGPVPLGPPPALGDRTLAEVTRKDHP